MGDTADKYISRGGRTASYGRSEWTDDLLIAANFLLWAEEAGEYYGGHTAQEAFKAMCRLIDMDSVGLRRAIMEVK